MRVAEGEDRGEDSTEEVDEAGADQVADAFDVGHDAGYEGSGTVLVVEGDGEAADVGLDLLRSSAMRRWAALERIWVRVKEVTP